MPPLTDEFEAPYKPTFAKQVERVSGWEKRANTYLHDTGDGSLRAEIATLKLDLPLNMTAALNLLGDTNKGKVVHNTKYHANQLVRTRDMADRNQTTKSANDHKKLL